MTRSKSADLLSIHLMKIKYSLRPSVIPMDRMQSGAYIARLMEEKPGRKCCTKMKTPVLRRSRLIQTIQMLFMQLSGLVDRDRGKMVHGTDLKVDCLNQPTAVQRGKN